MYAIILTPDDNGTVLVTCPDLPEVTTFGEDEADAMGRAADSIEEALAARVARDEDIPGPSGRPWRPAKSGRRIRLRGAVSEPELELRIVPLPPLTEAKVALYRALRASGVSKAELTRRLGWHGPQVDRLFDLNNRSTIEHIEAALRAIGKRLVIGVQDAA